MSSTIDTSLRIMVSHIHKSLDIQHIQYTATQLRAEGVLLIAALLRALSSTLSGKLSFIGMASLPYN